MHLRLALLSAAVCLYWVAGISPVHAADDPAAAAVPPSISETLTIPGWWVIGPFLTGVREVGVDPLAFDAAVGGVDNPLLRTSFPSLLIPGCEARWRYYQSGENGRLSVDYPEVTEAGMKLITDEWGAAGGNTVGYAFATLRIDSGPRRALLELKGAGSVAINGVPWPGDAYGNGAGTQPVLLQKGDNELKVGIGAAQRFSLRLLPVPGAVIAFANSATLPDLVRAQAPPTLLGLPVANTTTQWLDVRATEISPRDLLGEVKPNSVRIPPLCVANLALELEPSISQLPNHLTEQKIPVYITLEYEGGSTEVELQLEFKDFAQPHKVTFRSDMDGSVQYYGLLPPSNFDPRREYGLILSLHGAGVEGIGQASAYRPKDWAYVVAPTNRRPFGFDWQDWGQRDMLEVLKEVKRTCKIDANRVHLTGHSMGGHGTWLNALTFPGLWATAAPSAGWTRFDLYSPMFLRRNLLFGDPRANYIWQLAMRPDDTLALCENARNLPIYALEGGADDNVPPQQPRLLVERLTQLGYDVTYKEVPGMGHWWDDGTTPGTDCVDSAELNAFWESHVRDPWPKEIVFRSGNTDINSEAYWLQAWQDKPGVDLCVRAKVEGNTIRIITANTAALVLRLSADLISTSNTVLQVDDATFQLPQIDVDLASVFLSRSNDRWIISTRSSVMGDIESRLPVQFSSWRASHWKSVLMAPCRVVIPTGGTAEETEWCLQLARLYAWNWWYRANGGLAVVTDSEALADRDYSGHYICLGLPWTNSLRSVISADSPLWYGTGGLSFAGIELPEQDVSYKFMAPYTLGGSAGLCLVEGGTSLKALKRLAAMQGIYSGAGFPDWMVWDDEVKLKGMAGVLGMGFFYIDWSVTPELSYFNEDLINRRASGL